MDELRKLVERLQQPQSLSMYAGPNDMALALLEERAEILAAIAAIPEAIPPLTNGREYYIEHTGPHTVRLTPLSANSGGNG